MHFRPRNLEGQHIVWVCIQEGWDIPLHIAAGLLGRRAIQGGAGTYVLGMLLARTPARLNDGQ
jgi:hypothetical protein